MADPTLSNTTMELFWLEANCITTLTASIAEKIGSPDLSETECQFWLKRQEELFESMNNIAALVNVWSEQRQQILIDSPAQDLSEMNH